MPLAIAVFLFYSISAVMAADEAAEPHWHYPQWQIPIVTWLKALKAEDIHTEAKPITLPELSEVEARRLLQVASGGSPLATMMSTSAGLPDANFLWSSIWQPTLPLLQPMFKDASHHLTSGQLWLPSHPTTANFLALAYSLKEPWNPYFGNKAIARRAAAISLVALLGPSEHIFYNSSPESTKEGEKIKFTHPASMGFTLTFSAFTLLKVKDALPPELVKAWTEGLLWLAEGTCKMEPQGPQNMRLSLPVGLYYCYLATGNPRFKKLSEEWQEKVVYGPEWSPAGHYWEGVGRSPDGSYNGIAMHTLAELYSISKDPRILELLKKAYRLKSYLTLVEPDGKRLGATHFNDRDPQSFAADQFVGREIQFALEVPDAIPFLAGNPTIWPDQIDGIRVRKAIESAHLKPSPRIMSAHGWGLAPGYHDQPHQWGMLATLPFFMYQEDTAKLMAACAGEHKLPILAQENFTENFNNEFIVARRPGYHITLYAGRVTPGDNGLTNYAGYFDGKAGNFNGFGGGGISSFWTPSAGTLLIGRHSACEGYERMQTKERFAPGWQDWTNNHIIGRTLDDKVFTSARVPQPKLTHETRGDVETFTVSGTMPNQLPKQGIICAAKVSYDRRFDLLPSHVEVTLALQTDKAIEFKALYETLPMLLAADTSVVLLDAKGAAIASKDIERVEGVKELQVLRAGGGVRVIFKDPVVIAQVSKKVDTTLRPAIISTQALQVELPARLLPDKQAILRYALVPCTVQNGVAGVDNTPPLFQKIP
ncbi:MAG: hypothetical protein WCH98_04495 [Verrucomicrobiota bacterium]